MTRKKSMSPGPLTEDDLTPGKQGNADQASNDSDEDNLVIDTG